MPDEAIRDTKDMFKPTVGQSPKFLKMQLQADRFLEFGPVWSGSGAVRPVREHPA